MEYGWFIFVSCEHADSVTVINPRRQGADRELGTFCGSKIPPVLMSSSNQLELAFTSRYLQDSSPDSRYGFSARYRFLTGAWVTLQDTVTRQVGGYITGRGLHHR